MAKRKEEKLDANQQSVHLTTFNTLPVAWAAVPAVAGLIHALTIINRARPVKGLRKEFISVYTREV